MITKQFGTKLSALALALLLIGCGGGGSDGYYNNSSNSGTSDSEQPVNKPSEELVEEQPVIQITSSQAKLNPAGGDFTVTVRLTDNNGGGLEGKEVSLVLDQNAQNSGVINTSVTKKTTDANGYAEYVLNLKEPTNSSVIQDLISQGVNIAAFYTATDNTQLIHSINLKLDNGKIQDATALYNLRLSANKIEANVKGDNLLVTAVVVNNNGALISGQEVTLKVIDAKNNFVILTNDKSTTNIMGEGKFEIAIPTTLTEAQRNTLLDTGIILESSTIDKNGVVSIGELIIPVSDVAGSQQKPNITFGHASKLATVGSLDYQEEMSVRVVDNDGNPIQSTDFIINMQVIDKDSGNFRLGSEFAQELALDKADLNAQIQTLNTTISQLKSLKAALETKKSEEPDNFTSQDQTELNLIPSKLDTANQSLSVVNKKKARLDVYEIPARIQYKCTAEKEDIAIATKLTGDKITNIGNSYTASTNSDGEFKFKLTYFKTYAGWQTVRLNVRPKNVSTSYSMSYDYPLGILKSDFESEDKQPFDISPYNQNNLISPCANPKPWLYILQD
ncbi:Ig-like domain-containing protein [Acinetobacter schindleri]|uniref:hypothetical protein n=1 Tax=Acinetobacter schindleri TaxID=108981 RepID=UPI0021CD668A|nr:hypothetical protein [Acinetobacter schindleri]MCU4323824.1 hypothetical protein [Acinetobacter schindleri]